MKKYIIHPFIYTSFLFIGHVYAHDPAAPAPTPVKDTECEKRVSTFCNASAEKNINIMNQGIGYFPNQNGVPLNQFEIGCNSQSRMSYIKKFCGVEGEPTVNLDSTNIMLKTIRPMVLEKIRSAFYQKFLFEAKVAGKQLPSPPSCLAAEGERWLNASKKIFPYSAQDKETNDTSSYKNFDQWKLDRNTFSKRQDSVDSQYGSSRMMRALYQYDRTADALASCKKPYRSQSCLDKFHVNERIKMNFPMLFSPPIHTGSYKNEDPAKKLRERFRETMWWAMGAALKPKESTEKQRKAGEEYYKKNRKSDEIPSGQDFDSMMLRLHNAAKVDSNPNVLKAEKELDDLAKKMGGEYYNRMQLRFFPCMYDFNNADKCTITNKPEKICDDSIIFGAISNDPNIIRQAMTDMNESERAGASLLMCRWDVLKEYRKTRCDGIKVEKTSPTQVHVKKSQEGYPYTSDVRYTIVKGSDDNLQPHIVKMKVYFKNKTNLSSKDYKALIAKHQKNTNDFYNKAGKTKNMEFEIQFVPSTSDDDFPIVNMNDCYNADFDSNNCNTITQKHTAECTKTCQPSKDKKCVEDCVNLIKSNPRTFNRANAANLYANINSGVVNHEIGHLMGLDDEYQDSGVRYTDKAGDGENSLMRDSDSGVLLDRHLNQIMAPTQCEDI